jgi:hypothetical protein
MFRVLSRYEYWASQSDEDNVVHPVKKFTKWFVPLGGGMFDSADDAESYIKNMKNTISKSIDKSTKLTHEYRIEEFN